MLLALPVEIGELIAARPELAKSSDTVEWDEAQGTLKAWRRTVIGQLVIKTQPLAKPSEAELHQAMLNGIREKGLGVLNWTPEAEQLRLRLHCAAQWLPEEAWPAVDDASLLASLETWLLPQMNGVHSLRALKALDLRQALQDWLPWPLRQKLDRELPTHYTVPTGSRLAIRYHAENPPALAVRMQEMFGEATTPVIAEGAGAAGAGAAVACPASAADHPRSERLLARELPRGAERDEGTLSEARLAGRSGQRRPDPPQQKILVAAAAGLHPARPVGSQTLDHLLPEKNTPAGQRQPGAEGPAAAAATAGPQALQ
ncbi:ATP-dependent helicase HrpB [Klebsiella pneumoniae]|uniref:ATP-dependent helicase HrpB n=1 Tax=Klebsiella pneumoniae TaxID=573 RepID=A0A2X3E5Q2_KLEPN|nr:ATP-dependent helicase HrpB [Klebsiella pneumoniae]